MKKMLQVAWREYGRHVFTRRFMLVLLSVPLLVVFIVGMVLLVVYLESDDTPLGYVDHSGVLANPLPPPEVEVAGAGRLRFWRSDAKSRPSRHWMMGRSRAIMYCPKITCKPGWPSWCTTRNRKG